jgi:hypothetical protein
MPATRKDVRGTVLEKHDRLWFRRKMRPCWSILIGSRPNSLPAVHFPAQKVPPNGDRLTILFYARSCYKTLGDIRALRGNFLRTAADLSTAPKV